MPPLEAASPRASDWSVSPSAFDDLRGVQARTGGPAHHVRHLVFVGDIDAVSPGVVGFDPGMSAPITTGLAAEAAEDEEGLADAAGPRSLPTCGLPVPSGFTAP